MQCSQGHENPDDNRFCGSCGEPLGAVDHAGTMPPFAIRSPHDAELAAAQAMRYWGHRSVRVSDIGPDDGIDVESELAIAQVKAHLAPIGVADVQRLLGTATAAGKDALFFSLGGYTRQALAWGTNAQVAMFEFDLAGRPSPVNGAASEFRTRDRAFHPPRQSCRSRVGDSAPQASASTADHFRRRRSRDLQRPYRWSRRSKRTRLVGAGAPRQRQQRSDRH